MQTNARGRFLALTFLFGGMQMGFWGDVFHGVSSIFTAPINAITGIAGDLTSGKNVLESVESQAPKLFIPFVGAGPAVAANIPSVRAALEKAGPFTLGVSSDVVKFGDFETKVGKFQDVSPAEGRRIALMSGKDAGLIYGGYTAAAAFGGQTVAGKVGVGVGSAAVGGKLASGDFRGAAVSAASLGSPFVPDSVKETFGTAKEAYNAADSIFGSKPGAAPSVTEEGYPFSFASGYADGSAPSKAAPILVLAVLGIGAFVLLRRARVAA